MAGGLGIGSDRTFSSPRSGLTLTIQVAAFVVAALLLIAVAVSAAASSGAGFVIGWVILVLIGAFLYFAPAIVAARRGHHNAQAICVVNLFLGWTFVGWVVSLAWAYTAPRGKGF